MKKISLDWFWTPMFLAILALNSCSIAADISLIEEHIKKRWENDTAT